MKVTSKRYESVSPILTVMTSKLQSLLQYSIELRAAGFEGAYHPCVLEWFEDDFKTVSRLYAQLKDALSYDNLFDDLMKEYDDEK